MGRRCAADSNRLSRPPSGWYIHCHTSAIATPDATYGRKNIAWIARAPQERRSSASATPSARVIDTGTYSTYSAVLRSEIHTSGSRTIAAKLARPTNGSAGSARLQRCNDRYRANRTGATEKTARWSAEGVRNPHAATVSRSRCGRAASRSAHAASATASGPNNAKPSVTASHPAVAASPGGARSSAQRPGPRRTATTARGAPATVCRHASPPALSPPAASSAPRAIAASVASDVRVAGRRATAS